MNIGKIAKIGIGIGIVVLAIGLLKNKAQQLSAQFENIQILPVGFKNLNAKWNNGKPNLSFNLDLNFINPTPQKFNADGVILTLKKIIFFDKNNVFLGEANPNISALNVPAKSSTIIRNVPVSLDLQTTLVNAIKIVNNGGFKMEEIKTEAVISILGIEYQIKQ